jgi:hypothetical protein
MMTKGAILGCVMMLSSIAETYMFYHGGSAWLLPLTFEILISMALYVILIYRFTKNYSKLVLAEREQMPFFSFGEGFLYAMNISGLAGIVVALGSYLFMHYVIGYEEFIAAYVKFYQNALSQVALPSGSVNQLGELFDQIQKNEEPSIFSNLLTYVSRYIMTGALVGAVVALITKRTPWNNFTNFNNNGNEPNNEQ